LKSFKLEDIENPYAGDWIVFVIDFPKVIEIHSTGKLRRSIDDRCSVHELIYDAMDNRLHSQTPNDGGTRFVSNAQFALNEQTLG